MTVQSRDTGDDSRTDILRVEKLVKRFHGRGLIGGGFTAVKNVSFSISAGSIFGLVGESGSGKTTLARSILYLDPPTAGHVTVDGVALESLSARRLARFRRNMQIVFQDPNSALNPRLTVATSLSEGLANRGIPKRERREKLESFVDQVGIPYSHLDRFPHEFSGGQKQRLVIARALSMEPNFLVLDEPVSNLDVSIQAQIINLLLDLKKAFSLSYLFISHDLNLVSYIADTIGVMHGGRIVEIGPAASILEAPLHVYTGYLFASAMHVTAIARQTDRTLPEKRPSRTGCGFSEICDQFDTACLSGDPGLREVEPDHYVACFMAHGEEKADQ